MQDRSGAFAISPPPAAPSRIDDLLNLVGSELESDNRKMPEMSISSDHEVSEPDKSRPQHSSNAAMAHVTRSKALKCPLYEVIRQAARLDYQP